MKLGLAVLPPILFAGIRFVPAGLLLLAVWKVSQNKQPITRKDWPRLVVIGVLTTAVSYALMFWAMQFIRTGFAAIVDFASTPIFLLAFAVISGEERFERRSALAITLGVIGLMFLFLPSLLGGSKQNPRELWAALGVILSVAAYAWGSVLSRPLLRSYSSWAVSGWSNLVGGLLLLSLSLAVEDGAVAALDLHRWTGAIWLSWAFLVLCGTVIAATIFLVLVREWGPTRAGAYTFVSPVIAVGLGMLVFHEKIGVIEAVGMTVMLSAAYVALYRPSATVNAAAE